MRMFLFSSRFGILSFHTVSFCFGALVGSFKKESPAIGTGHLSLGEVN
jgi:hypothetical protein